MLALTERMGRYQKQLVKALPKMVKAASSKALQDAFKAHLKETEGHVAVLYTKGGDYSAILKIDNPVTQYCADIEAYYEFSNLLTSVVRTLGEGYALHKQDVFTRKGFEGEESDNREYLSESYFNYFEGRQRNFCNIDPDVIWESLYLELRQPVVTDFREISVKLKFPKFRNSLKPKMCC